MDKPALISRHPGTRWILARKVSQILFLLVFLALYVKTRSGMWQSDVLNLPFHLDPLTTLAYILADRTLRVEAALAVGVILLTIVLGRVWCGWICPLGTILDWVPSKQGKVSPLFSHPFWKNIKYAILAAILLAALFSNLTLLFLDPITLFFRSLSVSIWPMLDYLISAIEKQLYQVEYLQAPISTIDALLRKSIFPVQPVHYQYLEVLSIFFAGILFLNILAPRFWCRFLCPLGAFLGIFSRFSLLQRKTNTNCISCAQCEKVCPVDAIQKEIDYASDPSECIACLNCLETCRVHGNEFSFSGLKGVSNTFLPDRRSLLGAAGITLGALWIFRTNETIASDQSFYLLPPGGIDHQLTSKCIRCGECLRACPTGGLQATLFEAGIDGIMTPRLVPRTGFCDFGCNICGQVCPVEAIPALDLEEKRLAVIGLAYIDKDRCIAWADGQDCIVCEEMCPLPQKAVYLEPTRITSLDGSDIEVLLPYIDRSLCIGCGICEYKCPVDIESAIRIRSVDA